jgi:uncharacterized tellurite resistance protein B-like protein
MERFEIFKDLMIMAAADRKFSDEEVEFLTLRASRWGLTDRQFEEALRIAASGEAELAIPETPDERTNLLRELLQVMAADGELAPVEKQLFADAAARMEISQAELNEIIDGLL